MSLQLKITTSPHIKTPLGTQKIMQHVFFALLPVAAWSVYVFGLSTLFLLVVTTLTCALTENVLCRWSKKPSTLSDYSALITGLLLGLTLPPGFPLWMAALGAAMAIILGKAIFGGLGHNPFNPALVGRAFLQAAFPVAITTWSPPLLAERFSTFFSSTWAVPFMKPSFDAMSSATPLGAWKFDGLTTDTVDLFFGTTGGSAGETSALLILIAGIYLASRKMLDWKIPVSILLTVLVFSSILYFIDSNAYPSPGFMLFSGGCMIGAVFMATDMVSSPVTPTGVWLYGILIGSLIVIIRIWGGLPEGVMYSILLGNACAPIFSRLTQPKVFGAVKGGAK